MQYMRSIAFLQVTVLILSELVNGQSSDITYPTDISAYEGTECKTSGGLKGICRSLANCSDESSRLITRMDLCSFWQRTPIYCCANALMAKPILNSGSKIGASTLNDTSLKDPNKSPQILLNKEVYAKFWNNLRSAEKICERNYPSNVVPYYAFAGGIRSLAEQHPHMAAIGWTNIDGAVDWKCGGSVVTARFIITAAHCTNLQGIKPDIARTGDLNLLVTENNTFPQDFKITEVYVHPDYNHNLVYHDIGLLKISPDFRKYPICLWTSLEFPYKTMLGMGYGTTEFSGPRSNELFEGYLTVLSHEECRNSVPISSTLPNGIITGQFCAIDPNHVKDTCQGDSGGPLQFVASSGYSNRPVLGGVTSFGQYCAGRAPGVYTKVSSYLDWIEPILLSGF